MKSIACVIWNTLMCVLRFTLVVIYLVGGLIALALEWAWWHLVRKHSLSKGERSDPLGRERGETDDDSQ